MNKNRINRIAKYLKMNGFLKEAAQMKKVAQDTRPAPPGESGARLLAQQSDGGFRPPNDPDVMKELAERIGQGLVGATFTTNTNQTESLGQVVDYDGMYSPDVSTLDIYFGTDQPDSFHVYSIALKPGGDPNQPWSAREIDVPTISIMKNYKVVGKARSVPRLSGDALQAYRELMQIAFSGYRMRPSPR